MLVAALCLVLTQCREQEQEQEQSRPPTRFNAPHRIIATAPSNVEIICALGASSRLVGVSPFATYPQEVRDLPKVGGIHDPDLETILALRPDVVILRGHNAHVEKLCRKHGIQLYDDKTDTLDSLFTTIHELGELLRLSDDARLLGGSIRVGLDAVRAKTKGTPKPKVLLTLRSPDKLEPITTVAKGSYLHEVIELAGGRNVFGELDVAYPQVSLEEIIVRQPDVIIEAMPGEAIDETRRIELLNQWKAVGGLEVARTGRVYHLTEDYVLVPSPRVVLLAERLRAIFAGEDRPGDK